MKPLVVLYNSVGVGLIVSYPSGILFTNQVGGHACLRPSEEGIYIPLHDEVNDQEKTFYKYFTGPKWRGWCSNGIDEETAEFVDGVLQKSLSTTMITVDRQRLSDSSEAWIYVLIGEQPPERPSSYCGDEGWTEDGRTLDATAYKHLPIHAFSYPFYGFGSRTGVLTWVNSD
jgi:hypothetical protein